MNLLHAHQVCIHELILSGLQTNPPLSNTMAQLSKDELSFAEEAPKRMDIECLLCRKILLDPQMIYNGHNFCISCIKRVKASDEACPKCQVDIGEEECLCSIEESTINCPNLEQGEQGCQWMGKWKDLPTHTNRGKREGECQYQEVKCRYEECGKKDQRYCLDLHEKQRCPQRPSVCIHCKLEGVYCFIYGEHIKKCSKFSTPCPNECTNVYMPRDSIPAHLATECPLQPVDCVFSWAGCKERPLRRDIEQHSITNTKHMMLLAVACGELKKENERLKKENTYTHDLLVAVAADTLPTLPITVICGSDVAHFYTKLGGYHMSAAFNLDKVYLAFHEGTFDRLMESEPHSMHFYHEVEGHNHSIVPKEALYQKIPDNALVSFLTPPQLSKPPEGVITFDWENTPISSFKVDLNFNDDSILVYTSHK